MAKDLLLEKLSSELSGIIERIAPSIVLVQGKRFPSSGVVWQKNLVVTSDHTLAGSDEFRIHTSSGQNLDAAVAGRDPSRDIAFLKTDEDLPPLKPTQKKHLQTGHLALIAGKAAGGRLLTLLTMISGADSEYRNWRGGTFDQFIRLDTAPFPGFSGSALIDSEGNVAGINSSSFSRHFGLTIPASNIDRLAQRLLSKGFIARPYLGVMMQPAGLPEKLREQTGATIGLLVVNTVKESPAEAAGLGIGDILVRLDGKTLNSMEDLQDLLTEESIGKSLKSTIVRGGIVQELELKVGERPVRTLRQ